MLRFTYPTAYTFEQYWWDFDQLVIDKFAQYFHVGRALTARKIPGYLLAILSYLVTYLCSIEVAILLTLWLSFHSHDALALWLNHMLVANSTVG